MLPGENLVDRGGSGPQGHLDWAYQVQGDLDKTLECFGIRLIFPLEIEAFFFSDTKTVKDNVCFEFISYIPKTFFKHVRTEPWVPG